jgi:peptidoglycan/xylan/chitin deacetylase (PgdA/CDA1 family)
VDQMNTLGIYYALKPVIPRRMQISMRRIRAQKILKKCSGTWPINPVCELKPANWNGWPDGKTFCLVLSHDVDTQKGHDNVLRLLEIEKRLGIRSAFNFVPERYNLSLDLIKEVQRQGFEVAVHGLKHDGKLFSSRELFNARAKKINHYLELWGTKGFTTPSMIRNLEWMDALNIEYATCTFDTDPFEPQPDGICSIFPFRENHRSDSSGYVELPYTLPQDFTMYIILGEKTNQIWKSKLDWIVEQGGMALLNTHPDYMNFDDGPNRAEEYSVQLYTDFIEYIKEKYKNQCWHAVPSEVAAFVNNNYSDNLMN